MQSVMLMSGLVLSVLLMSHKWQPVCGVSFAVLFLWCSLPRGDGGMAICCAYVVAANMAGGRPLIK